MLAASAREAGAPLPLLFLHDVGWPYGRRDLYYAPERIPEQYRQPYAMKGLRLRRGPKGQTDLLERGGVNPKMNNALHEGGPRNGVMTALEDFMREHDREVRVRVLPIYFSLAIAADEERIAARQALGDALDRLDAPALLRDCLELAERLRLKEMHWGHQVFYTWQDKLERMAERYLDLLSAQLPARPADAGLLEACLETIRTEKIEGDLMQLGAAADDGAVLMRAFLQAHEISSPSVWVVDPSSDGPSLGELREHLRRFELLDERVRLLAGEARDVLADVPVEKLALLRVGTDADPRAALDLLYEKLVPGGYLILEDGGGQDRRRVVNNLLSDDVAEDSDASESGAARWRKVS
jgi:hypothetical protein